jgi:hypothetical protein
MKRTKTLLLATFVASVCAGLSLQAQNTNTPTAPATNAPPPQVRPMPHSRAEMIMARLKLDAEQTVKARPIIEDMDKQMLALPVSERRVKGLEIRQAAVDKLKDILTDEQYNQCKQLLLGVRRAQPSGNFVPPGPTPTPTNSVKPQP